MPRAKLIAARVILNQYGSWSCFTLLVTEGQKECIQGPVSGENSRAYRNDNSQKQNEWRNKNVHGPDHLFRPYPGSASGDLTAKKAKIPCSAPFQSTRVDACRC